MCFIREQSKFYNSGNLFGLFVILVSTLTSCQFANEPKCEISRGVLQNHGVCGQVFPLLPFHFFCSCSYIPAITGLEMLAMQATEVNVRLILMSKDIPKLHPGYLDIKTLSTVHINLLNCDSLPWQSF